MIFSKDQIESLIMYAFTMPRDYVKMDLINDKLLQIRNILEGLNPDIDVVNKLITDNDLTEILIELSRSYTILKTRILNQQFTNSLYTYVDKWGDVVLCLFEEEEVLECYLSEGDVIVIFNTEDEFIMELTSDKYIYYKIDIQDNRIVLTNKNDRTDVIYTYHFIKDKKLQRRLKLSRILPNIT
ncbi:MAG: hypothetical protein N4A71_08035 [Carboxylicivirga sp.]|jgi:superfamily II RNA helicase|nr:hypothetical protein [Carboxylicivirga sp.]